MLENGVPCNGQLVFNPQGPVVSNYVTNGYDNHAFTMITEAEQRKDLVEALEYLYKNYHTYVTREKFTEWPSFTRLPYHGLGLDQCAAKGASKPWLFTRRIPVDEKDTSCRSRHRPPRAHPAPWEQRRASGYADQFY